MTIAASAPTVDERLDQIAARLEEIGDELARQRAERERWSELASDLTPLARHGLEVGSQRLAESGMQLADLAELGASVLEALPVLTRLVSQLESTAELAETAAPLLEPTLERATERLADLDERGYFEFTGASLGVIDRVVTSFDSADIEALGDNIVLILQTVRDMTQPEVMTMLRRTFTSVSEEEPATPPGTLALLRQLRDPGVRRGLAKVMNTLRSIGDDSAGEPDEQRS
jgi:uncharacterized protein YjgD (DUF1641 family)